MLVFFHCFFGVGLGLEVRSGKEATRMGLNCWNRGMQ